MQRLSGVTGKLKFSQMGVGDVMTLTSSGNVGIGTTSPGAKLDVAGQIHSIVNNAGSATAIDWSLGNAQYTSAKPIGFVSEKGGLVTRYAPGPRAAGSSPAPYAGRLRPL